MQAGDRAYRSARGSGTLTHDQGKTDQEVRQPAALRRLDQQARDARGHPRPHRARRENPVVEDKTGEDITRLILLQVIAEQEQFGKPILTTQLLESIIRYYGGPMQDFMAGYLEQSVAAFMRQQESVQQQISQMLTSAPPPMNAMAELSRQNMEMWNRMQEGMLAFMGTPRPARSPGGPKEAAEPDEVAAGTKSTKNSL